MSAILKTNLTDTHYNSTTGFSIGANIGLTPETKDPKPDTKNTEDKTTTTINSPRLAFNTSTDTSVGKTLATVGEGTLTTSFSTGMNYERTKTLATLGQGNINITDKENSDDLARLNTDTTQVNKSLFKTDTGTSASGTLDTRLLTAEGRAQIADDAKKAKEHAQDIANGIITVATDDQIDITNLVDTVRDNISTTKLKDYLTQTKDGQQILEK